MKPTLIELKVIFKGEDKKMHKQSFPIYEKCALSQDDETIQKYIAEARQSISWIPEETSLKIDMEVV